MFDFQNLGPLPESMKGTYDMLKCAFPEGIPDEEYKAFIGLLQPYMSNRACAILLAHFFSQSYFKSLSEVEEVWADGLSTEDEKRKEGVRQKLLLCGYAKWLEEHDY